MNDAGIENWKVELVVCHEQQRDKSLYRICQVENINDKR